MSSPRTVLYLHHSNDLYGADVMLLETVQRLDPALYRPLVVLPEDTRSEGGLSAALQNLGVEQVWLPLAVLRRKYLRKSYVIRYGYDFARAALSVYRLIRSRKVALVHSNTLAVMAGACGAWLADVAHVWHVHEIIRKPVWFRRLLHRACTAMPRVTLCISKSVRNNILEDEPAAESNLRVIYNGLSLDRFVPKETQADLRQRLDLPEGVPVIGMVGRINQWKGQDVLVECAALLREQFPAACFLIVGSVFSTEFHHLTNLKQAIADHHLEDRIRILNFRDDVADLLAAMDVYVHLSVEPEPFGLSIIEAMACGLPVIATAPGGPGEIIENGVSGILVPPRAALQTSEAITLLLTHPDLRKKMGHAAQRRALELFHVNRYATELQALYAEIMPAQAAV